MDFGAGSLRESYDLATIGFDVTSVDLDSETLGAYQRRYEWPIDRSHRILAADSFTSALAKLTGDQFALITCFDVLEHLEDPSETLTALSRHLTDNGLVFISVPNGRTLFELFWRLDLKIAKATGRYIRPGEPHLQRNSPAKWREIIQSSGLTIKAHEMHIGFFANNAAAMIQVPLALAGRVSRKMGFKLDGLAIAERAIDQIAPAMDFLDRRSKFLEPLYGWNLFVIAK
ncbi:class I SAM-dependent methyltransferase [Bradyrhizobium iriomotense]|nr:class I SAM-dependent methyltransferase [Bradyrhizobium iriomotense]